MAQDVDNSVNDSIILSPDTLDIPDDWVVLEPEMSKDTVDLTVTPELLDKKADFKPNPTRAVIYSAILPGLGQIYNRKYWKLPLVYGGFLGCTYAISWNGNQYSGYKDAYKDWVNRATSQDNSWVDYVPVTFPSDNPDDWTSQQQTWFENSLKSKRDYYRRYRDLSYIVTIGLYALCMIDAYVDAQLFDFDINQDLSMKVEPVIFDRSAQTSRSVGLQCSFKF